MSIIIAVFTFERDGLPNVYPNAISGAFSFFFAFVTSILSQILIKDLHKLGLYLRFATYFFLGVGILYLLFIALSFSEDVEKINQTLQSWAYGIIAISSTILVWRNIKKLRNKQNLSLYQKSTLPILGLITAAAWLATAAKLSTAVANIPLDDILFLSILLGGLSVFGTLSMSNDILLIIKKKIQKSK